ncbi:tetratricopeptide repeat protein [uncultured Treponema sp.]|uniref:tetratricopeptide repeat protein n=1 Tax=uncultured Treponema sp. TaxID=162155 RepID=UPI0025E6C10A|nr:tetratricopeptide repeat protein [uncultured Treponema sp.]
MADKNEKETLATSLNSALEKSKGLVFAVAAVVVLVIVAVAVVATVKSKATANGIEQIDTISYNLTNVSSEEKDLSAEDIAARQTKALEELASLSGKSGVVGLRANMLVAEIKFAQKNYEEARAAWLKAAEVKKNAYTASLCYYNAAVCSENLGDTENAVAYYKSASEDKDFLLVDHALFSLGRVNESAQKYEDAKAAYEKLSELHPTSSWAQMAQSQLISLKVAGKISE